MLSWLSGDSKDTSTESKEENKEGDTQYGTLKGILLYANLLVRHYAV